jgi:hypothetical protein
MCTTSIIIAIILVIYFVTRDVKNSLSGKWTSNNGDIHPIVKTFRGVIVYDGDINGAGTEYYVILYKLIGVNDHDNTASYSAEGKRLVFSDGLSMSKKLD